ncbi:hypothetical protein [Saccharibacillus alkalitolerans]|uniref:DUF308 domain-containing protein n=1 Tax=Saccharibacillus alkalitolerans TaxID=2705290 RepID=A0ABX0FCW0_9BACL|nr:hypothetical protein [Saccharibacillus alkalitolerans]NGZ78019.1 hypothetical protein [Saccharibacillus alkalitolerans]
MRKNVNLISWGLILTLINLVGSLWIGTLIDVAAYLMVYVGASRMKGVNPLFRQAGGLALTVILLSVINAFLPGDPEALLAEMPAWAWGFDLLGMFVGFALVYAVCEGTRREAEKEGEQELERKMKIGWQLYIVPSALAAAITPFALNFGEQLGLTLMWLAAALLSLVAMISIIVGLRRAGRDLRFDSAGLNES